MPAIWLERFNVSYPTHKTPRHTPNSPQVLMAFLWTDIAKKTAPT